MKHLRPTVYNLSHSKDSGLGGTVHFQQGPSDPVVLWPSDREIERERGTERAREGGRRERERAWENIKK